MIFRRPYRDLIRRQLDLFVEDHGALFEQARDALRVYHEADRDEAEERYGDYAEVLDQSAAHLAEIRDRYARTLDDPDAYRAEFERAAAKRFPQLGENLKEI